MILLDNVKQLFHRLFIVKTTHKLIEFFRYFFVSIASLCTDFIILFVLSTYAGLHYLIAAAISYVAGLVVNYLLSINWVFSKKSVTNKTVEFSIFVLIGFIGLGINQILMWLFTSVFLLHFMFSRVISAGIGYVWKYIVRKYLLFR